MPVCQNILLNEAETCKVQFTGRQQIVYWYIFADELVRKRKIKPLGDKALAKARKKRKYEKQVWTLVKEGTSYFLFLLLVSFIVWASRPPGLYHSNQAILREIAGGDLDTFMGKVRIMLVCDVFLDFKLFNSSV